MAKSFNLPSPEEYGRKLAEKRRRASGVPEVLANLAAATEAIQSELKAAVAGLAEQTKAEQQEARDEARQTIGEAIEAVPIPFVLDKLQSLMDAVEGLSAQVFSQYQQLTEAMMPERPEVDLSAVEAKLAAIEARVAQRNEVQVVEAPVPATPSRLSLVVTDRDASGDISSVEVEVTKH